MLAFLKIFLYIVLCLYVFISVRVWGRGRKIAHVELSNDTITLNHSGAISLCCYCTVNLPRTGPQPPQPVPKMSSRPCLCQIQVFWSRFFFFEQQPLEFIQQLLSNCNKLFLAPPLCVIILNCREFNLRAICLWCFNEWSLHWSFASVYWWSGVSNAVLQNKPKHKTVVFTFYCSNRIFNNTLVMQRWMDGYLT